MKTYPNKFIYERDKFTCQYCGWSGADNFELWNRGWLSIDHVIPKKYGGDNKPENLVVACHTCNSVKGFEKCNSIEEGKLIIARKNIERKQWFEMYVLGVNKNT